MTPTVKVQYNVKIDAKVTVRHKAFWEDNENYTQTQRVNKQVITHKEETDGQEPAEGDLLLARETCKKDNGLRTSKWRY